MASIHEVPHGMTDPRQVEDSTHAQADDFARADAESLLGALAGMFSLSSSVTQKNGTGNAEPSDGLVSPASVELGVRYRTLLEQIPAVVFMAVLEDGRTEAYVSPHIENLLGFRRDEWLDDPVRWYYQIHPDDRGRWNVEAANFLLTGQPLRSVYRVLARDGRVVWFHGEAKMVRRPNGQPWFIHGVGFDITDLKNTELELKRARDDLELRVQERTAELQTANANLQSEVAERKQAQSELARRADELARTNADLEQFAYSASHDLQEPIRNVSICSQLLAKQHQSKLNDDARHLLNTMVLSARHMESLVLDLLEYTRVARASESTDIWSDAKEVLGKVLHNLQLTIDAAGATVTSDELPPIRLPAVRLQQILQNLISNAVKYRGTKPPRIHVSAVRSEEGCLLSVTDNGIGIAPKYHERIFGIFKRLHSKDKYPGTGIGLAICKRIVENAGGRIWVESDVDQGASFKFYIPAAPPSDAASHRHHD
jgi:PAS domain S-box-containing protein